MKYNRLNFFVVFEECSTDMGQIECVLKQQCCEITLCKRKECGAYTPAFYPEIYAGLIILGSDEGQNDRRERSWIRDAMKPENAVPILGICHGAQLLAQVCNDDDNWKSFPKKQRHEGLTTLKSIDNKHSLFTDCQVYQSHECYFSTPNHCDCLAESCDPTQHCEAFHVQQSDSYGIQFHPELHPSAIRELVGDITHEDCVRIAETGRSLIQAWVARVLKLGK